MAQKNVESEYIHTKKVVGKINQYNSYSSSNKIHTSYHFMVVLLLNSNQGNKEIQLTIFNSS